jgi:hypothetical protein
MKRLWHQWLPRKWIHVVTFLLLLLIITKNLRGKHFYSQHGKKLKVAVLVPKKLMGGPGMVEFKEISMT